MHGGKVTGRRHEENIGWVDIGFREEVAGIGKEGVGDNNFYNKNPPVYLKSAEILYL